MEEVKWLLVEVQATGLTLKKQLETSVVTKARRAGKAWGLSLKGIPLSLHDMALVRPHLGPVLHFKHLIT